MIGINQFCFASAKPRVAQPAVRLHMQPQRELTIASSGPRGTSSASQGLSLNRIARRQEETAT
jgi:hypothetical protein